MLPNRLKTYIALMIALFLCALMAACGASSNTVIKIDPAPATVQVSDTVAVPIKVENITNLTTVEVHLSFDANMLEVVKLQDGDFIKADFPAQSIFDNSAGTIDYVVAQISRPPANGSGTLFEIVFRAKGSGNASIRFRETQAVPAGALMADANGKAIQALLASGNLVVGKP